jgi:hypothetical protein
MITFREILMKLFYLTLLLATLPSTNHTNAAHALCYYQDEALMADDLTPPLYEPGDPIRHNIPIYDLHTREIITTASSVYAYEIYLRLNDLYVALEKNYH